MDKIFSRETTIPIAFATDDNYVVPTLVAFKSLVLASSVSYNYCVYILTEKNLSERVKKLFDSVITEYKNFKISFLTVGHLIGNIKMCEDGPTKGISKVTYYRFLLPKLISEYDKILYLDTDIFVCGDAAAIYFTDVENYYVAGVPDVVGHRDVKSRCKELNINSLDQYVNAGVLVFNLKKLRIDSKDAEMLAIAKTQTFPYNDQDIINSVCFGKIKILPYNCNVIVDYVIDSKEFADVLNIDYIEKTSNPIIIHYAGRSKPWYSEEAPLLNCWRECVASFTGFSFWCELKKFKRLKRRKFKHRIF